MSNNQYLGKWVKKSTGKDGEGDYVTIDILEVTDGLGRSIGQNIPVSELGSVWVRPSTIIADPFAAPLGLPTDIISPDFINEASTIVEDILNTQQLARVDYVKPVYSDEELSPSKQFVKSAMQLSNETTAIDFQISHELPFDIHKIRTLSISMNLDRHEVADMIVDSVRKNPEVLIKSMIESVMEFLRPDDIQLKQ